VYLKMLAHDVKASKGSLDSHRLVYCNSSSILDIRLGLINTGRAMTAA
jgi:hypothetical protein